MRVLGTARNRKALRHPSPAAALQRARPRDAKPAAALSRYTATQRDFRSGSHGSGSDLIFRFARFCGRQSGCLVGSACAAGAHLLLAALEIVAQVLRQALTSRLGLAQVFLPLCRARRMLLMVVALHALPISAKAEFSEAARRFAPWRNEEKCEAILRVRSAVTRWNRAPFSLIGGAAEDRCHVARSKTSKCGLRSPSSYGNRRLA